MLVPKNNWIGLEKKKERLKKYQALFWFEY